MGEVTGKGTRAAPWILQTPREHAARGNRMRAK